MIKSELNKGKKVTFIFDDGTKHVYIKEGKGYRRTVKGVNTYSVFIPLKLIDFELKIDQKEAAVISC
jgi:hypothetical protein